MTNLFNNINNKKEPLAKRLSPNTLSEFFGQNKLVGKEGILRSFIEKDNFLSSIFYGPPGCGKTALAKIIAKITKSHFIRLNAVTDRVDDLREAINKAKNNKSIGIKTILFIDEIHRFNKMQQDGLLPALEEGVITLIGITTKNPFFYLIPPLRSRVLLFEFEKLSNDDLKAILEIVYKKENLKINDDTKNYLIKFAGGDARRMLNLIEAALIVSQNREITLKNIERIIKYQPLLYDRDENYHYDIISAFIKSVRGSDPNAALYWLSLMLQAGEDPLFIARRLIILASEDIGLANSFSLVLAQSCYDAVERIGMPEARIILSHVTIYLSLQPKSNSSYKSIEKATEYIKNHEAFEVPFYLRSSGNARSDYKYPHDYKYHFVKQDYIKKQIKFYEPEELGDEKELKKRFNFFMQLRSMEE